MRNPTPNELTLRAYDHYCRDYIRNTPSDYQHNESFLKWINFALANLSSASTILEVGSGPGRDAEYIKAQGFKLLCSDGALSFVDYLNAHGQTAVKLDILKDAFIGSYDLIFADAVIPHFTIDDLRIVFPKINKALSTEGLFAFNVKQGNGEVWINEKFQARRFTRYWQPQALLRLLSDTHFKPIFFEHTISGGNVPSQLWIHVVAKKI